MKQYEHKPTITKYLNNLNLKFTKLRSTDPGPWHTDECSPEVKHIHMSVREAMLLIMCTLNIRLYILICAVKGPESLLVPLLDAKGTAAQRLLIGPCIHFIEICLKRKWTRVSLSLARSLALSHSNLYSLSNTFHSAPPTHADLWPLLRTALCVWVCISTEGSGGRWRLQGIFHSPSNPSLLSSFFFFLFTAALLCLHSQHASVVRALWRAIKSWNYAAQ